MRFNKKIFAQQLRKQSTPEEIKVWKLLRNRKYKGLKFRRQHVIDGFIVDFYCHELRLAIEIDGKVHLKQKEYDEFRQYLIEQNNIKFIRITNEEIINNVNILLHQIEKYLTPPLPSSQ
ncbi:MAG TPA: endonuclease domain-containing protein [Spirochaetota bacterium]|nr:endonuclease domain-containing protein [Spirochaetota bacterium]HRZ27684.1 endonuclease domain-containing protein [Spirochaetota bacterium]HSA15937.1 endonuclease domain-containing protein [Spirochaetota bacterium]